MKNYKLTRAACFLGMVTQAICLNLAPLFFVIFHTDYGISYERIGRLVLFTFAVQIVVDLACIKIADKLGFRKCTTIAQATTALGLIMLGLLPRLFPNPYPWLILSVCVYAVGSGFLEVIVSPIIEAIPKESRSSAEMSLLHSFYCWGQMAVVLLSTLALRLMGSNNWFILPLVWALVPLLNLFLFLGAPMPPAVPETQRMKPGTLFRQPLFWVLLAAMVCGGASELSMSQWASTFAEKGLHISKTMGDLLGPCMFAGFMGIGRAVFGRYGDKLPGNTVMLCCGIGAAACYLLAIFAPLPVLGLAGCALCGLAVSLMWPGTLSAAAARFPLGGTAMFSLLAMAGDLGGSLGPWITGLVADHSAGGLKAGLLAALIFPLGVITTSLLQRKKKQPG